MSFRLYLCPLHSTPARTVLCRYAPFKFFIHNASSPADGTPAPLDYSGENVLAVRVDALTHQEGWFYEGGGELFDCFSG